MRNLKTSGVIVQFFALLIPPVALLYGLAAVNTSYPLTGVLIAGAGILLAAMLFGIGASFKALARAVENSGRAADALDRIAKVRANSASPPVNAAARLRDAQQDKSRY